MIQRIEALYDFVTTRVFDRLQHVLLLIGRLYIGYELFLTGKGKLENLDRFAAFLTSLHVPAPQLNAPFVASLECFGGLLLLAGLASRIVTIPLTINFIVAYATGDHQAFVNVFNDPDAFIAATPFLYLLVCLVVLAFGPGVFSLDALIARVRQRGAVATAGAMPAPEIA